jgi:hypothetical protein
MMSFIAIEDCHQPLIWFDPQFVTGSYQSGGASSPRIEVKRAISGESLRPNARASWGLTDTFFAMLREQAPSI